MIVGVQLENKYINKLNQIRVLCLFINLALMKK